MIPEPTERQKWIGDMLAKCEAALDPLLDPLDGCPSYDGFSGIDPEETAIPIGIGFLVFPSADTNPRGCDYVRVVGEEFVECGYWTFQEWEEEPISVMGAIMGAIADINDGTMISTGKNLSPRAQNSLDKSGPCGILPTEQTRESDETTS